MLSATVRTKQMTRSPISGIMPTVSQLVPLDPCACKWVVPWGCKVAVGEALSLSERIFRCSSCSHEADRDTNAAACLAQYPRVVYSPKAPASGAWPHVAAKHAETQNVCGEESAGARPVWSVRETVLREAERTSVQRPRRAVLLETVNTL